MNYSYYTDNFKGNVISAADWPRLSLRAEEKIERYENIYDVTYFDTTNGRNNAICAMAETISGVEDNISNAGVSSVSVGSVSTSFNGTTITEAGVNRTCLATLRTYANIYRGN